jgi:hypothetical protein
VERLSPEFGYYWDTEQQAFGVAFAVEPEMD